MAFFMLNSEESGKCAHSVADGGKDLPKPNDDAVKMVGDWQLGKVATIQFSGRINPDMAKRYTDMLKKYVKEQGLQTIGEYMVAGYDSPMVLVNRRNEIIVRLADHGPSAALAASPKLPLMKHAYGGKKGHFFRKIGGHVKEGGEKEPCYKVLHEDSGVEVREYDEQYVMATYTNAERNENSGFMHLAGYIFGGNDKSQQIPMTKPVLKFANDGAQTMAFFMLDSAHPENSGKCARSMPDFGKDLPKPNDGAVKMLGDWQLGKVATISYSGHSNPEMAKKYTDMLKKYVDEQGWQTVGAYMVAGYDSPWTMENRRNEIMVRLADRGPSSIKKPATVASDVIIV